MQIFEDVLFFKLQTTTTTKTTEKQTFNSTHLVSVGCGRLAEGKGHETEVPKGSGEQRKLEETDCETGGN